MPDLIGLALASKLPTTVPTLPAWQYRSQPNVARVRYTTVVAAGQYLIAAHGVNSSNILVNTVDRFDTSSGNWAAVPAGGSSLEYRFTAYAGGRLHLIGGDNSSGTSSTHDVFTPSVADLTSGTWTTGTALPSAPFTAGATVSIGNTIYLIGGADAAYGSGAQNGSTVMRSVDGSNPAASFVTLASVPTAGFNGTAAVVGGRIYYWPGSLTKTAPNQNAYVYDVGLNSWSEIAGPPYLDLSQRGAVVVGSTVWLVGTGTRSLIYDPATNSYAAGPALPNSYFDVLGYAAVGSTVYIGPAGNSAFYSLDSASYLDVAVPPWNAPGRLTASRGNAACASDGTVAYVANGISNGNLPGDGFTVTAAGVVTPMTNSPGGALVGVAGAFAAGAFYQIGGSPSTGTTAVTGVRKYVPAGTNGAGGTWSGVANLPNTLYTPLAAAIGSFVYVLGGTTGSNSTTDLTALYRIDVTSLAIVTLASSPVGLSQNSGASMVAYGGKLYAFGPANTSTVYIYDPAANTWTTGPTQTNVQTNGGYAVVVGTTIYVGNTQSNAAGYRPASNTWESWTAQGVQQLPGPVTYSPAAANIGAAAIVIGGTEITSRGIYVSNPAALSRQGQRVRGVQQYLAATNPVAAAAARRVSTGIPNLLLPLTLTTPDARSSGACSCDSVRMYYTGGNYYSGNSVFPTDGYTFTTDGVRTGITTADPAGGRYMPTSANLLGVHYSTGGFATTSVTGGTDTALTAVTAYTPAGTNGAAGSWATRASLPQVRGYHGAAVLGGFLYVAGGRTQNNTSVSTAQSTLYRFDPTANTWTSLANLPVNLMEGALLAITGKLFYLPAANSQPAYVYTVASNTWALTGWNTPAATGFRTGSAFVIGTTAYGDRGTAVMTLDLNTGAARDFPGVKSGVPRDKFANVGSIAFSMGNGGVEIGDVTLGQAYLNAIAQTKALAALAA